jgi:restriction system protein
MIYIEILVALLLAAAFFHFYFTKKNNEYQTQLIVQHIDKGEELKKTLAMGLYLRFMKENEEVDKKYSSIYLRQNPLLFESFVAEVIGRAKGGSTWVSPPSNDYGVDFEHTTDKGLYLGQVKCYQGDLSFNSIALIHSNMVKREAIGGYVITTGSFTNNARRYAEGLNIELIDGVKLVDLWLDGLENAEQEIKDIIPEHI